MAPFFTGIARGFFKAAAESGGGAAAFSATGGTTYTPGNGYKYHTFTASGAFTVSLGTKSIEVLVVAGGGGGNSGYGGGGGAGGVVYDTAFPVTSGPYSVSVGSGGAIAATGTDSSFTPSLTAKGGGRGNKYPSNPQAFAAGGSGGGGAEPTALHGPGIQPTQPKPATATNYGNPGGRGSPSSGAYESGGGGGAGAPGVAAPSAGGPGGAGGAGQPFPGFEYPIVGLTPVAPVSKSPTNNHYGGGGGGWGYSTTPPGGFGGAGGGGDGGYARPAAGAGVNSLGGGGGGNVGTGAKGGDGVVIIRYLL